MRAWKQLLMLTSCVLSGLFCVRAEAAETQVMPMSQMSVMDFVEVSSITDALEGKTVTVKGKLTQVRPSTKDNVPWMIKLTDKSGTIDIVFWKATADEMPIKPAQGQTWRVTGTVGLYREKLQMKALDAKSWIKIADADPPQAADKKTTTSGAPAQEPFTPKDAVPTGKVDATLGGREITVAGKMIDLRVPKIATAPYVMKIDDGTGSVNVVFWQQTVDALKPEQKAEIGEAVRLTGTVGEHKGDVQIKLASPSALMTAKSHPDVVESLAKAIEKNKEELKAMPLSMADSVKSAEPQSRLHINCTVKENKDLRLGQELQVDLGDGDPQTLFLWDSALGALPADIRPKSVALPVGTKIDCIATVELYGSGKALYVNRSDALLSVELPK